MVYYKKRFILRNEDYCYDTAEHYSQVSPDWDYCEYFPLFE